MPAAKCELGMVGLGVMGRNFLLNIAEHGHRVVGYDKDSEKVAALRDESEEHPDVVAVDDIEQFVAQLRQPRSVMMLVPAGPPVDSVIHDLLPHLEQDDLIIDGGNSHFPDTDVRGGALADKGLLYLGVGISGGEEGARHGPSIMPGGPREAYERVAAILTSAAAKVNDEPCVAYLGPGSAGHYVKMVHNGIEYGLMQLLAETYDLMKRGLGLSDDELADVYRQWNDGALNSYLVEITSKIFRQEDPQTDKRLIDVILDEARQKGTGMWMSQDAMELQTPSPTIDMAVDMRHLSALKDERETASGSLEGPRPQLSVDRDRFVQQLGEAMYSAMIIAFAQGMAQLHRASEQHDYGLQLADVARIWRGGCIIRAALLDEIRGAFQDRPDLQNLLLDNRFGGAVVKRQEALRTVVGAAAEAGIPAGGFMTALAYFDGYRSAWLPANLIQAQRDFFGSHTYERIDAKGKFHTHWSEGDDAPESRRAPVAAEGAR